MKPRAPQPVTIERIERAILTCADLIETHGDHYAPYLDRLEEMHRQALSQNHLRSRVNRILSRHTVDGGLKAIR